MKLNSIYSNFRELILYGIIGCVSSTLDFLVFTILFEHGIYYVYANCISVIVGIVTSFTLNRKYNFKVKDKTIKRFITFLAIGLGGMLVSNAILYLCIDKYELSALLSKLFSIGLVVLCQFLLNKFITFKRS